MTQYILVSDTHLGHKSTTESFDMTLRLFQEICEFAQHMEISHLIHLGDFYDKKSISFKMLEYVDKIRNLLEENFTQSYLLVGNHDIALKDKITPNGLSVFYPSPNISVIEQPTKIGNKITLFPWVTSNNIHQLKEVDTDCLFGHFGINEIPMNRYGTCNYNEPLSIKDFQGFGSVISGHYHQPSYQKNITYIGSPYHISFNESGQHGYYIFDGESEELEFIEFDAPKFIILNADQEFTNKDIFGNHIRVDFFSKWSTSEIEKKIKQIQDLGALSVSPNYKFSQEIDDDGSPEEIASSSNKEIMEEYLTNLEVPKGLKHKTLQSIMESLYKECFDR